MKRSWLARQFTGSWRLRSAELPRPSPTLSWLYSFPLIPPPQHHHSCIIFLQKLHGLFCEGDGRLMASAYKTHVDPLPLHLLCLKCRGTGHKVNQCPQSYRGWRPFWFFSEVRRECQFDSSPSPLLCTGCKDLDIVQLLHQQIPWTTVADFAMRINQTAAQSGVTRWVLQKTERVSAMSSCKSVHAQVTGLQVNQQAFGAFAFLVCPHLRPSLP
jgi:hypothetical protein